MNYDSTGCFHKNSVVAFLKSTESFSKLSILLNFDPIEAELFEVNVTMGHY